MIASIVMALVPSQSPQLSALLLALSGAAATVCHHRARRQLRRTRFAPPCDDPDRHCIDGGDGE